MTATSSQEYADWIMNTLYQLINWGWGFWILMLGWLIGLVAAAFLWKVMLYTYKHIFLK